MYMKFMAKPRKTERRGIKKWKNLQYEKDQKHEEEKLGN